ncbi:CobQ/CobB/MinD/ParA nucleotide binding domain protein [Roseivivax sp. THAF40]|uniref:AAA family ATPase n=1 Tax=unclassified Roseivivax TaxID=2639302 RepID=UPI001267E81A|nr:MULTISPECIES: AAA family ATPase [unclassified Roseivivax]QFS81863.1 CobQ/CobB/MinD/ParA nucleotide binding domain protein [Roseivivax sp. THAF197b]QFT45663.1 CobQ/CobB/MinD/ParA nucleotide binding domain protein [Roseivivax sp. THAF40]
MSTVTNADAVAEAAPIVACTISRDVQIFDLLIEDMESLLGEAWGDLGFAEALAFLGQPEADSLDFVALAIDDTDEDNADQLMAIITTAKARGVKTVLIAEDVSPATLHRLLKNGADEFVPYPLPEGELAAAVERIKRPPAPQLVAESEGRESQARLKSDGDGVLLAVQGMAGGVGTTTFAVNLAWELANVEKDKDKAPRVCLLDLGLQFGSAATYLDLPRKETIVELLADIGTLDQDTFAQALQSFEDRIDVFTAPSDLLPLDMITQEDVSLLLGLAREHFDYIVVDMPSAITQWSETVLQAAQVYFAMIELDMRSAQNTLRLKRALQSEDLPFDKLRFVLNRAPKFTDLQGKSRAKRMAESLDIGMDLFMPDGGRPIAQACDHGLPIALQAAKNPLRKEIAKLAQSLHEIGQSDAVAA